MLPLMLHHSCALGPIRAITARITPTPEGCEARFILDGRLDGIVLPPKAPIMRRDGLWKSTCLEVFWQPIGAPGYCEINIAPSGEWAAYDFDSYRENMRNAALSAIAIERAFPRGENEGEGIMITAQIAADLPAPAQVGLSAVIEDTYGALQYWALGFAPGRPDFHSEACRTLIIER